MSSATGMGARRARERLGGEGSGWRLAAMVSLAIRFGQAQPAQSLLATAALVVALSTRHDPARFLIAGGIGLVGLSGLLFRDLTGRVLFGAPSLLLLGVYVWAGTESLRLGGGLGGAPPPANAG